MIDLPYDSREETLRHIGRVRALIAQVVAELLLRGEQHDASKLEEPEKSVFDSWLPYMKQNVYGTPEYDAARERFAEALKHHYACSRHHPEHHESGVDGMTLIDVVEMFCDWRASTERTKDGDIYRSIEVNTGRFQLSPQLASIFRNTAQALGW